ncbi:outer membrane efflux protein [Anseongella ginsenosidimutans]|uniref:Outer membrane efflux protein n=1 Tax=Anseongella ginsenosidimutans TaxID=496056 RepID=A0A4R3KLJ0_9SPHI|nr:TolC family protein [Anseongella ginsenosidimutans]QEC52461.1 TolC family protein [Anseongella ginsenosidimutans]TCS84246.1 outer membrane efflux protein [Anseongella ginsenosidimutans]
MKKIYLYPIVFYSIACLVNASGVYAQNSAAPLNLSLKDAIGRAQENSFDYQAAYNQYQRSFWDFQNYKAAFYPKLHLDGTFPNYTRAIGRVTLPTGEDIFVEQNQAYSSLDLGISQNVKATGGVLTLSSSVNRIDVFGNNRDITYSAVPLSITYRQNSLGFNSFKWQKQIAPLLYETAQKELTEDMENISLATVGYYFEMLAVQAALNLSRQNLASADTLYKISSDRFRLGTVSKSDLLQLRLSILNAQNQVTQDSVSMVLARQKMLQYLDLPPDTELALEVPDEIVFFAVDQEQALKEATENSKTEVQFQTKELEAKRAMMQAKAESRISFSLRANLGVSKTAPTFPLLYNNLDNQQNIMLTFSLPLLDWGDARTRVQRAASNLELIKSENKRDRTTFEQEVLLQVSRWNLQQKLMAAALETREIALERYELDKQRYLSGNITLNDLNIAQQQKDQAINEYVQALETYWDLYYRLRKLTLYDFKQRQEVEYSK